MHEYKNALIPATSDSLAVIVIREPKTLGQRFSSQKSASCTACFKFPHPEISVVGNISCKKTFEVKIFLSPLSLDGVLLLDF